MSLQLQFRLSGWLIIIFSLLVNGMNILVYLGHHNTLIQALYGIGFVGLIFASTVIHAAQSHKSGVLGLLGFLASVVSLLFVNVLTFLILADLSGIEQAHQTSLAIWNPGLHMAVYGCYIGLTLFGISIVRAGVFPAWAGAFTALGIALQFPAQSAIDIPGPLFFLFTVGGSLLFATGLIRIGWILVSGRGWIAEEPGISPLDRKWGGPVVIFTGLILAVDAIANMIGQLSLTSGLTHMVSYVVILLAAFLLYTAHGERVSWSGYMGLLLVQLGTALYFVTAFLIVAQLAGAIDNNRMLMASWVDIPVGRIGGYMITLGMFLFGVEAVRSGVFPPWSGWLVILGLAFALPFLFTIQAYFLGVFWVLGAIIEGIGLGWMGWILFKRKPLSDTIQTYQSPVPS